ncbi:MAG: tripartite tricarboxylate transporter TctB family protein [Desulfobulbaceae bacterium]|nr:tripartite tricarboxylate transporter TctB family protein [Desulfobulbaceae bacterium]
MKYIHSFKGLVISIPSLLLLLSTYKPQKESFYVSEGGLHPLVYPRILFAILLLLGLIIFLKDLTLKERASKTPPRVLLLSIVFISYYFLFIYFKFYISTVFLCIIIASLVDRKFRFKSILFSILFPMAVWAIFVYGLGLQISFI